MRVLTCAAYLSCVPIITIFLGVQGLLKGFDQHTNLVLDECHERVYSADLGVESVVLGLYIIRGDNMCARQFPTLIPY